MKLNTKKIICVGFAFFLISMFWQVYDTVISKILIDAFGLNQTWSGVVMALDNIIAVVLLPVFGKLSDDTNTKWGKRTPYIVVGTVIAAALIVVIGIIHHSQVNILANNNIEPVITETVKDLPVFVKDFGNGIFDANKFTWKTLTEEGTKYVVATEEEVVDTPYEAEEPMTAEEVKEAFAELEKEEEEYFINSIQTSCRKTLNKKEMNKIRNQIKGNVNNTQLKESLLINTIKRMPGENKNETMELLIKVLGDNEMLKTLSMLDETGLITKFNSMEEPKRRKTAESIVDVLEKRKYRIAKPSPKVNSVQIKKIDKDEKDR